jgi:hypothetical protein
MERRDAEARSQTEVLDLRSRLKAASKELAAAQHDRQHLKALLAAQPTRRCTSIGKFENNAPASISNTAKPTPPHRHHVSVKTGPVPSLAGHATCPCSALADMSSMPSFAAPKQSSSAESFALVPADPQHGIRILGPGRAAAGSWGKWQGTHAPNHKQLGGARSADSPDALGSPNRRQIHVPDGELDIRALGPKECDVSRHGGRRLNASHECAEAGIERCGGPENFGGPSTSHSEGSRTGLECGEVAKRPGGASRAARLAMALEAAQRDLTRRKLELDAAERDATSARAELADTKHRLQQKGRQLMEARAQLAAAQGQLQSAGIALDGPLAVGAWESTKVISAVAGYGMNGKTLL